MPVMVPDKPKSSLGGPVWKGPTVDGVSQSLLGRYLSDKERFRIYVMEGLKEEDAYNHKLEYGNMWHVCEEALAGNNRWETELLFYAKNLVAKYRESGQQIEHWYQICRRQFPIYVDYWKKHPDVKDRKPLAQEELFAVDHRLPSGRVVKLRGKMDAIDLIGKRNSFVYIQENKAKGDVDKERIRRQLSFDLQTMTYSVAADEMPELHEFDFGGARYNVIRRPLSDNRGSFNIRQRKGRGKNKTGAETNEQFYDRLAKLIAANPDHFFVRFKVEIASGDIGYFKRVCLHPILENLLDDYEWWSWCRNFEGDFGYGYPQNVFNYVLRAERFPRHLSRHFIMPFGVYSPLFEGRATAYDEYIATKSEKGLERVTNLFPELS